MIWETETIEALLAEAESTGSTEIELGSSRDAQLFRQAIYNRFYTAEKKCPFVISVSDRTVSIRLRAQLGTVSNDVNDPHQ